MNDGSPAHMTKFAPIQLPGINIAVLERLSNLLDFNPIENAWNYKKIYKTQEIYLSGIKELQEVFK